MNNTCIIIAGPTAVGKTSCAIALANQLQTTILSFDSRQCYRELNIAVAKPSTDELQSVPHHFINSLSINDYFSAAEYEQLALETIEKIFEKNKVPVLVGGTGLYLKAFCEGFDSIPDIPEDVRQAIINSYKNNGVEWLISVLKKEDPLFSNVTDLQNPQRMMRALEVIRTTGQSIKNYQQGKKQIRSFQCIKIGLELPRELLYERINNRVDHMVHMGLIQEAESLFPFRELNALQTVGYRELFDYFDGQTSLEQAINLIKQHSRQYAKRQLTWFKRDPEMIWMDAREITPDIIMNKMWGEKY